MTDHAANTAKSQLLLQRVTHALERLEFGSVEITVHQGRIVQIERREKERFDHERRHTSAPRDTHD